LPEGTEQKTLKDSNQDNQAVGLGLNPGFSENKTEFCLHDPNIHHVKLSIIDDSLFN
jgi:hypothetical protein